MATTFLLAASVAFCFILSTGGAGAQSADDHGNTQSTATDISLGSSIAGHIDYGRDADVFRLDLSGASGFTNVWIYTTGELDSWGQLHDRNGSLLAAYNNLLTGTEHNFHIRAILPRGVYYITVFSADDVTTENYTLHAQVATDPGNTVGTATNLVPDSPTPGTIGTAFDADYFRLDFTGPTNVVIYVRSGNDRPIELNVFDAMGSEIYVNGHPLIARLSSGVVWYGFRVRDDFEPGTYYIKVSTSREATFRPVPYTMLVFEDIAYSSFIEDCEVATRSLNDPMISDSLYGCQWHLDNPNDWDINVEDVWAEGIKGAGVNIAVVDNGMDYTHEDLAENVDVSRNHDYTGLGDINHRFFHHGTHLSGILAARDNDIGVRGVSPRSTIYGYNLLRDSTDLNKGDAMARNRVTTAVSNNSWGPVDGPGFSLAPSIWESAIKTGLRTGYEGKGTFYAWAGGNGHLVGDVSNLDEHANYYGVTAVCAVNDHDTRSNYSEMGANLWICAPSNDLSDEHRGIVTIENSDRYFEDFGGTSAATPVVSGVAALMRSVNHHLTWRDLKLILAASARKNDADNPGWEVGGRKYGSDSDRYNFNHEYGFGVVDAKAAVDLAKGWYGFPPLRNSSAGSNRLNARIPDPPATDDPATVPPVLAAVTLNTPIEFTEFVEITLSLRHDSFRDLEIELMSPSGAVSRLVEEFDTFADDDDSIDLVPLNGEFSFGSARHLGEDPNGVWQLRVTDRLPYVGGILESWSITVYGHEGGLDCIAGDAIPDAVSNPGLVSDCEALLAARRTLAGTAKLNWSSLTPMAEWEGVTIGGTPQRVTELNLYGSQLTGAIPVELGNLTNLRALLLSQNQLSGPIPVSLAGLSNLEALDARGNQLTGAIPTELGSLAKLRSLSLGGNTLTGAIPAELGSLSNLLSLSLGGNTLTGTIPAVLGKLAELRTLSLEGNSLTGAMPAELVSLSNLKELYLSKNQLSGQLPAWLGRLANLYVLSLAENQLTGPIPAELGSLSNLGALYLSGNQLSGVIPAEIGDLSNLRRLYLSGNQLEGCVLQQLRDVAESDLNDVGLPFCDVLLSGLTIDPGSLTTPFDPFETEYIAVGPSRVTVIPVNEYNATFRYLDENGNEIADADRSLDGHQVDVRASDTTIRIMVMSQDGQTSLTYTLLIVREDAPPAPVISAITPGGGSLTVVWTAPAQPGGSDITSYDVRYIESGAPDKADENWTVVDDAWTSGPLTYAITGLAGDTQYDVQVRAVNAVGDGLWSDTENAATTVGDLPVFADGVTATRSVEDNSVEGTNVGMPIAASDANDNALTYTLGGADATLFTIEEDTGQIKVGAGATLDYEAEKNTFAVDVTATGSSGASATINVTIAVIDANLGTLGSRYDANRDRKIDRDEVIAAIVDYFDDLISRDDVVAVIVLYFSS